jgi:hypothetical protein
MTTNINETTMTNSVLDNINDPNSKAYLTTTMGSKGALPSVGGGDFWFNNQDGTLNQNLKNNATMAHATSIGEMDVYRGLGAPVNLSMSLDEQLEAAGLDFEISNSPIRYGDRYQHISSQQRAIYKKDGTLLDVVSERWAGNLLQTKDILHVFNDFCAEAGIELERVGAIAQHRITDTPLGKEKSLALKLFCVANMNEQFDLG